MLEALRKLRQILTRREKLRLLVLLVAVFFAALFEVIGVASIMPFMQLVSEPEAVATNEWLQRAYTWSGVDGVPSFLVLAGAVVILLLALANLSAALSMWLQARFSWSNAHSIATRLLRTYLSQPYAFFLDRSSADLGKQVLSEVEQLISGLLTPITTVIAKTAVALGLLALLLVVDPLMTLVVIATLCGAYGIIFGGVRKYLDRLGRTRYDANEKRYRYATEALATIKAVKIAGSETFFASRFADASRRMAHVQPRFQVVSGSTRYFVETVAFGGVITLIIILISDGGDLSSVLPLLSLYAFAGYRLLPHIQQIYHALNGLRFNMPVVEAIYHDLSTYRDTLGKSTSVDRPSLPFDEAIEVLNLSFRYNSRQELVLRNVGLKIEKGARVAFVGPTGSGKTTLIDLLTGLLFADKGVVRVDDTRLEPRNASSWQSRIGYVPQDVLLYDDTIRRNIAFGLPDTEIDDDRIVEAAHMADIDVFIRQMLPDQYETTVGERGIRLSGGQRQRIGLARVLYRRPDVLVLDEATSALDGITEETVMGAIDSMNRSITIIMVAHRLSTVRGCDRIFVLEDGKLSASGSYEDLLKESSVFQEMSRTTS